MSELSSLELNEEAAPATLSAVRNVLDNDQRLTSFYFVNDSAHFVAVLVLYQGLDETGEELPPNYVRDTGLIVGAQNVAPKTAETTATPLNINIVPNRVKCSFHWRSSSGQEGDFTLKDDTAPAGEFVHTAAFGFSEQANGVELFQHLPGKKSRKIFSKH